LCYYGCFSLIRGQSQTIDSGSSHYSTLFKEHTPQHKTKMPHTRRRLTPLRQNDPGWLPWFCIGSVAPMLRQEHGEHQPVHRQSLNRRTGQCCLSSIDLCLSMLFSKNSEVYTPKAFEKNTSSTPHNTVPVSPGFSMITHLISTRVSSGGAI